MKQTTRKRRLALPVALGLAVMLGAAWVNVRRLDGAAGPGSGGAYPEARREARVETLHGRKVADPYRWLEDLTSAETRAWVEAQDAVTGAALEGRPGLRAVESRLRALTGLESQGVPVVRGGRSFFLKKDAGAARPSLLVADASGSEARALVDEESLGADVLSSFWPGPDGERLAYGVARVGSRWLRVRILEVASGRHLPDELVGLHGGTSGAAWSGDGGTLFYSRYVEPAEGREQQAVLEHHRLYAHRVGTPQAKDALVYSRPDRKEWAFTPSVTDDGRYLVVTVADAARPTNRLYYVDLAPAAQEAWRVVPLFDDGEAAYRFLGSSDDTFWIQTTHRAPRGRVVAVDLRRPQPHDWRELVQQSRDALYFANVVADRLIAVYLHDAKHVVRLFDLAGRPQGEAPLPDLGTTFSGFVGRRADRYAYYSFNSLAYPGGASVFRLDPLNGESSPLRRPELPFEPTDYPTRQVFFTSKDGTRVPMFIAHRKGLKLDGSAPTYLYAYGAFAWPATPWFQAHILAWMEMGGVYALANIRGGGEYGERWHQAGIGRHRQNAVDDFIAAAEWLIENRVTSGDRLSINGGSASAPLAAAALTQRPELFAAVTLDHPILDLLRFDRFTGGARWKSEFGSPEDPGDFRRLLDYSPLHAVEKGVCYPPTLVTASDRDETAVPSHAYKFTAALQYAQGCDEPVLLQVVRGGGHTSFGNTPEQAAGMYARQLAFLAQALEMKLP
jgi:prolyl oligopeptidase